MRRMTLPALVAGALALSGWLAAPASAHHSCAEGFEIVCYAGCPSPPKICPWP